jgi:hypothetical protein
VGGKAQPFSCTVLVTVRGWPDWANFRRCAIVYFGHFFKLTEVVQTFLKKRSSPFLATFSHVNRYEFIWQRNRLGYILVHFLANSSGTDVMIFKYFCQQI